jgi:hypothetical protein
MPDVKMLMKEHVGYDRNFSAFVSRTVAEQLTCVECEVSPHQVDVLLITCRASVVAETVHTTRGVELNSNSDAIIEVAGYAYPSRMDNIEDRLKAIARGVKKVIGGHCHVSITYFEVANGCWTSV